MRFLLLINILLLSLSPLSGEPLQSDSLCKEYNLRIFVRGQQITGICVMENREQGSVVGTVINEMGVKVFDFTFENGKARILNVIGPANRWFIRRALRKDFNFILAHLFEKEEIKTGRRKMWFEEDDICFSGRHKIEYRFTPLKGQYETD